MGRSIALTTNGSTMAIGAPLKGPTNTGAV
jgi:hypothetical protein